jgi:DNA-binding XRE family transcriptional regulator
MEFYTLEESMDICLGKKGTPHRDQFDAELAGELEAWRIGQAIREQRKKQNLTQKQLGEKVGVGEAQISKIENGHASTLALINRVFRALGATSGAFDFGNLGRVAMW